MLALWIATLFATPPDRPVDCEPGMNPNGALSAQLGVAERALSGAVRIAIPGFECKEVSEGATRCRGTFPGAPYVTNLFFPKGYQVQDELNAAIFFHGHDIYVSGAEMVEKFDFPKYASQSSKNRVIIVPEQNPSKANFSSHFGALADGASFQNWMSSIAEALKNAGAVKNPRVGKLALAGHSRAYTTLSALAREKSDALEKVHSVAMFDGYNNFTWKGQTLQASQLLPLWKDRIERNKGVFFANSVAHSPSSGAYKLLRKKFENAPGFVDFTNGLEGETLPADAKFVFVNDPAFKVRGGSSGKHYHMASGYFTPFLKSIPE